MKNKLCYADTDPRMKTFDGKPWTASLAGEFVMYRDTQRRIAVIISINIQIDICYKLRMLTALTAKQRYFIWDVRLVVFSLI